MIRSTRMAAVALLLAASGVAGAKNVTGEDMTGRKERQMAHCPSAVPDAKTTVEDIKSGVVLSVTATGATAREEIRRRAHRQEEIGLQSARGAIEHTGAGTGTGKFGFCPGMSEGTRVSVEDLPNGARMTVRESSEPQIHSLQKTTRERLHNLPR